MVYDEDACVGSGASGALPAVWRRDGGDGDAAGRPDGCAGGDLFWHIR